MITNRNRIEGISRDGKQALDSEAIKLSVTANVNSVSSSESKKSLPWEIWGGESHPEVSSDHSSWDTSFKYKGEDSRTAKGQITKRGICL